MDRINTRSRALRSIGYDPERQVLEIEFSGGRIYQYDSVPASLYEWLLTVKDKGGVFQRMVRDKFEEREVTPPPPEQDLAELLAQSLQCSTDQALDASELDD